MAKPTTTSIEVNFKVRLLPDGRQIVTIPDITKYLLQEPPASSGDDHPFALGQHDAKWIAKYRAKIESCERDLMQRLITKYYGMWPEYSYEPLLHSYITMLFVRIESMLEKRANLAMRLHDMAESAGEHADCLAKLQKLNLSLVRPMQEFHLKYQLLEHCLKRDVVRQNRHVAAFLSDLNRHSDEFREGAWHEKSAIVAKEREQQVEELRKANMKKALDNLYINDFEPDDVEQRMRG